VDPDLFQPEKIDPKVAAHAVEVEELIRSMPDITAMPVAEVRQAREEGRGVFGPLQLSDRAQQRSIPGPAGRIPLRIIVPDAGIRGVYLHIHGGGWTLGAAHHSDVGNENLARACGVATVSVDYRLAPENPYPAGPDDCEAAACWLADHASTEFGTDRICIGGESAGAHLAAVTMLRMRDRHGYTGFAAANLVYGQYDMRGTPGLRAWGNRPLVLNDKVMAFFSEGFLPDAALREDPDACPFLADLTDMPPALFTVGTLDPLLEDSIFMHGRWVATGNRAELAIYPGGIHAFDAFPIPIASQARNRMHGFLAAYLGGS